MNDIRGKSTIARLTERARLHLGRKYLDWAEMLPEFGGGLVADLQIARKFQRKEAKESAERCRLPEGLRLRYSLCVLTELFPVESFGSLDAAITKHFPEGAWGRGRAEFIRSDAPSLTESGWWNVGVFVRESKFRFGAPKSRLENLPPEVEHVSMHVHKVLPSAYLACFCAFLNDSATSRVQQLADATYLPAVRFRQWVPLGRRGGGRSETPADLVREEAVLGELLRIRVSIEEALGKYFQGYFFNRGEGRGARLPAIEAFDVVGAPSESEGFHWGWGIPLGLDDGRIMFDGYREDNRIFIFSGEGRCRLPVAHRFLTLHDTPEDASVRRTRLALLTQGLIGAIGEGVALLEFLRRIRGAVEGLRSRIYRRLAGKSFSMGFRGDIRLHRRLQKESLLLDRLELELAQHERMRRPGPSGLSRFIALSEKHKERNLGKDLSDRIDFQLDTTSKHLAFVLKCFSDYVTSRNMDLTYRMQIQVYVLTALATLAAVLTAAVSNGSWLEAIFSRVLRLFGL